MTQAFTKNFMSWTFSDMSIYAVHLHKNIDFSLTICFVIYFQKQYIAKNYRNASLKYRDIYFNER